MTSFSSEFIENDVNGTGQSLFSHVTYDDTGSLIAGGQVLRNAEFVTYDFTWLSCNQIS